jgi:hypothetical protein
VVGAVFTLVGVVVAVVAWRYPRSAPEAPPTTPPAAAGVPHSTGSTTAAPAATDRRYLTDLPVAVGASSLQTSGRLGPHSFAMPCGSGQSNDQHRLVEWNPVAATPASPPW